MTNCIPWVCTPEIEVKHIKHESNIPFCQETEKYTFIFIYICKYYVSICACLDSFFIEICCTDSKSDMHASNTHWDSWNIQPWTKVKISTPVSAWHSSKPINTHRIINTVKFPSWLKESMFQEYSIDSQESMFQEYRIQLCAGRIWCKEIVWVVNAFQGRWGHKAEFDFFHIWLCKFYKLPPPQANLRIYAYLWCFMSVEIRTKVAAF